MMIYPVVKLGSTALGQPALGYQSLAASLLENRTLSIPVVQDMQHLLGNAASSMAGMMRFVL